MKESRKTKDTLLLYNNFIMYDIIGSPEQMIDSIKFFIYLAIF